MMLLLDIATVVINSSYPHAQSMDGKSNVFLQNVMTPHPCSPLTWCFIAQPFFIFPCECLCILIVSCRLSLAYFPSRVQKQTSPSSGLTSQLRSFQAIFMHVFQHIFRTCVFLHRFMMVFYPSLFVFHVHIPIYLIQKFRQYFHSKARTHQCTTI